MTANKALKFREDLTKKKVVSNSLSKKKANIGIHPHLASKQSYDDGETLGSYRQDRFDLPMLTDIFKEEETGSDGGVGQINRESSNGATRYHLTQVD